MEHIEVRNIVRLGPRVPMPAAKPEALGTMDPILNIVVPDRVVEPRSAASTTSSSSDATGSCGANSCETSVSGSSFTMPIVLGVAIPVIGAAVLFLILHRRHVRKQRNEDANDRNADLDFGMGDVPQSGRSKNGMKASDMNFDEKRPGRPRQLSMDMALGNPYLLPPELQNSRESLHSLSRSVIQEDPYRHVTQYFPGDGSSTRSHSKQGRDGSSTYTGSSAAPSRMQDLVNPDSHLLSNAANMSRSNPLNPFVPPPRQISLPQSNSSVQQIGSNNATPPPPPYPVEPPQVHLQEPIQSLDMQRKGLPTSPRPSNGLAPPSATRLDGHESFASNNDTATMQSNNYLGSLIKSRDPSPTPPSPPTKSTAQEQPTAIRRKSPPSSLKSLPATPRPARKEPIPTTQQPVPQTFIDDASVHGDGIKVTPPSPGQENHRYSMDVPPEEFANAGLGAPGFDPRRLSMGFRPLPPDNINEVDDPEVRANRIRSFYKEYFDENRPAPQGQYYEDYDQYYLGDAAYYDPETNNFVMPYAQPITRRAMTPPPRGPRFQGPHRAMHGSIGAMSTMSGGIRGPGMYPPGHRHFSSASGRMGPPGQKRRLPPTVLSSLPTPSKLRDDSFALMNATDFAPPQSYRERVQGRSESPLGERRPYSPTVRSFTPTVSAFEELAPIPSPHMLRKSGTFTSLDFAPPKKFRDPDSMSDSGSIRSNRSGISARQVGAIRNGAYRVSRLPQDMVGTKDDFATALKPQWSMRPGAM